MAKTNYWGALVATAGALVAVGLLMLVLVVGEARPAGTVAQVGTIAYNIMGGAGSTNDAIYTMRADGTMAPQFVTGGTKDGTGSALAPDYSPSGVEIA